MKTSFQQFAAVALNSARADVRRPRCLLLALVMLILMLVLPGFTTFNLGEESRMARDGALAVFFLVGMVAAFAAPASIHGDRDFTVRLALTLSKPVSRATLLFGQYAAWAMLVVWHGLLALTGVLLVERIAFFALALDVRLILLVCGAIAGSLLFAAWFDYRQRGSFCAVAFVALLPALLAVLGGALMMDWRDGSLELILPSLLRILPAGGLIIMAMLIMTAVTAFFTVRLPLPWAAAACLAVFMLGMLSDYIAAHSSFDILVWLVQLAPSWQDFWMADALTGSGEIAMVFLAAAGVYTLLSVAAWLCGTLLLFRKMELR